MSKLQNTEKINVYVPEGIGASLKRDAELFEIFRANRTEVNLNRFMSMLIAGYYNGYKKERNDQVNTLKEIITPYLKDRKKQDDVAAEIMENVIITNVPKRKGKNPVKLPLKPTLDTDQMITEIKNSLGPNDYLSQYLCRMFMSYSEKPVYDRERIIFLENVAFLEEACREHREIAFATTINPGVIHHVIPYELVYGPDENFNYLICQEYNEKSEKNEAKTFKLCRINRPG